MDKIVMMYFTSLPLILAGICNMVFTKTKLYKKHKHPIDNRKVLKDNKRIFGDNKTWLGGISMIFLCFIFQLLMGIWCDISSTEHLNTLYDKMPNIPIFNVIYGMLIGIVYIVCELPNSFIKRRIDIPSGKTVSGIKGILFFIIDQFDSIVGVMAVLWLFSGMSFVAYIQYVLLGGCTHLLINGILYGIHIRKNL